MSQIPLGLHSHRAAPAAPLQAPAFDFLVVIGHFQPFHNNHQQVIMSALSQAKSVIVLISASHQSCSTRNPWSWREREQFIRSSFLLSEQERLIILPLIDAIYHQKNWVNHVQHTVKQGIDQPSFNTNNTSPNVGLMSDGTNNALDHASLFPQWPLIIATVYKPLSARAIREDYFLHGRISEALPTSVKQLLKTYKTHENYAFIAEEWQFIKRYQRAWEAAPYPPTFVTVDAVIVQADHILLIERKSPPGRGQLALPGGFLNQDESLRDAMVRELCEETCIHVPSAILLDSIIRTEVFDHPQRSSRGRTITHAYLIKLKATASELPRVEASDDAQNAFWLPLSELDPERLFEDHLHIIKTLTR